MTSCKNTTPEILDMLNSETFQHSYIQTVLNFSEAHDWDLCMMNYWYTDMVLCSPPITHRGVNIFVEIETYISDEFSFVNIADGKSPGKLFAHPRIQYPEDYWENPEQIDFYTSIKGDLSSKLASLKLGKIAQRSSNDPEFLEKHFTNFCMNAVLELKRRLA